VGVVVGARDGETVNGDLPWGLGWGLKILWRMVGCVVLALLLLRLGAALDCALCGTGCGGSSSSSSRASLVLLLRLVWIWPSIECMSRDGRGLTFGLLLGLLLVLHVA